MVRWRLKASWNLNYGAGSRFTGNVSIRGSNASNPKFHQSRRSAFDRHWCRNLDTFDADPAPPGQNLQAFLAGARKGVRIGRIDVAGDGETLGGSDLDDEEQDGARAGRPHRRKLVQMCAAPVRHGIGEFGQTRFAHEIDVVDFYKAGRLIRSFQ